MACPQEPHQDDDGYDEPDCMCGDDECPRCGGRWCWTCGGDGYGCRGTDFANDDPVNEPDGEVISCPNCGGSGLGRDCWYW